MFGNGGTAMRRDATRDGRRTVELHERIECPDLGVVAFPVGIGSTNRHGLKVSSVP
jgi:hypothetical protein